MFSFLSDLLRWFGQGFPTPPFGRPEVFQVTRRRSGTRSARISWTRHSAERRSPRDAPMVEGWESCGRGGRGVRRPLPEPATGRDCSSSTTSVNHRGPPSMSRRVGYQRTEQMSRKKSRKVRETRSSISQKRSEPKTTGCLRQQFCPVPIVTTKLETQLFLTLGCTHSKSHRLSSILAQSLFQLADSSLGSRARLSRRPRLRFGRRPRLRLGPSSGFGG